MLSNQAVADSVKLYGPVYLDTNTWHPADENNVPTGLYIGNGNVLEPGDTTDIPEAVILVSLDTSNTGEFSETLTITGGELTESIPLSATVTKLLVFPPRPPAITGGTSCRRATGSTFSRIATTATRTELSRYLQVIPGCRLKTI